MKSNRLIDADRALAHLMDLLRVEGLSGRERPVADLVIQKLRAAGVPASCIAEDDAHRRIPENFGMGNLIMKLPGTKPGPRLLFSGHLDTVPITQGAEPVVRGGRIVPKGKTALGGDNRTAVAALVTLAETLFAQKLPHPPITLLFTVGEETGLWGARFVKPADLGRPAMGFNIDSGDPAELTIGAIGAVRWEAFIEGIGAHAGVHPQHGVSAHLIAARAIAALAEDGWWGKVRKPAGEGTSNVGIVRGGQATNEVTASAYVKGECRSHNARFLAQIEAATRKAFERAAKSVRNNRKASGRVRFVSRHDYEAFRLEDDSEPVCRAQAAVRALGLRPTLRITNGGLDANELVRHGIRTVTLGAGQHNAHSLDEYVDTKEFFAGCELILRLATGNA